MHMSNLYTAAREYANRPKDERFASPADMIANADDQRRHSKEVTYNAKDLRAVVNGESVALVSPRSNGIPANFTHWSFGQLCQTIGAPSSYLRTLDPTIAADCMNFGLRQTENATDIKLLVQAPNGKPEPTVRAATSEKYGRVWDSELYGAVSNMIMAHDPQWKTPPTWSGDPAGAYRGDRDSFLIVVNGGSIVTDPSLRDGGSPSGNGPANGMYRGIMLRNSEVGAAAVTIETVLFRYICGNHIIWNASIDQSFRRRHIGANALRDTLRMIATIAQKWAHRSASADEAIIKSLITHEIALTREGVLDELRGIGFTKDQATEAYDRCEREESASPRSWWGIAQGATRASQDSGYQNDRLVFDQLAAAVLARGRKLVAA